MDRRAIARIEHQGHPFPRIVPFQLRCHAAGLVEGMTVEFQRQGADARPGLREAGIEALAQVCQLLFRHLRIVDDGIGGRDPHRAGRIDLEARHDDQVWVLISALPAPDGGPRVVGTGGKRDAQRRQNQ